MDKKEFSELLWYHTISSWPSGWSFHFFSVTGFSDKWDSTNVLSRWQSSVSIISSEHMSSSSAPAVSWLVSIPTPWASCKSSFLESGTVFPGVSQLRKRNPWDVGRAFAVLWDCLHSCRRALSCSSERQGSTSGWKKKTQGKGSHHQNVMIMNTTIEQFAWHTIKTQALISDARRHKPGSELPKNLASFKMIDKFVTCVLLKTTYLNLLLDWSSEIPWR